MYRMSFNLRSSSRGVASVADIHAQQKRHVDMRPYAGRRDDSRSSHRGAGFRDIHDTMAMVCSQPVRGLVRGTWLAPSYI
jgi:hypothetical protein